MQRKDHGNIVQIADNVFSRELESGILLIPGLGESTEEIRFITGHVKITDKIVTQGRSVFIACETLDFEGKGRIHTGFTKAANNGDYPAGDGAYGESAGNITIIAKTINSLRISTKGQKGGTGGEGKIGGEGEKGDRGSPGPNAKCPSHKGGNGYQGGKGHTGGQGEMGGRGGDGGTSGNVSIWYYDSQINLSTPSPEHVDFSGGDRGDPGPGGKEGPGGDGGDGGDPGKGTWCTRGTRNADWDVWVPGGERSGPRGPRGDYGPKGPDGPAGTSGNIDPKDYSSKRFETEDEFTDAIVKYIPSLIGGKIREAEILFMLNHYDKAQQLLSQIKEQASDTKTQQRAELLLERLISKRNYFNYDLHWAPIRFKKVGDKDFPKTYEEISNELNQIRSEVAEAEELLEYRREQIWKREQAQRAYEFEAGKLNDQINNLKYDIDNFERDIKHLSEKIESYQNKIKALGARIERNLRDLVKLPKQVVQHAKDLFNSITGIVSSIGKIVEGVTTENWGKVLDGFGEALGHLESGAKSVEGIKTIIEVQLRDILDRAQDEMFYVRTEVKNLWNELKRLRSRKAEADAAINHYRQTLALLNNWRDAQNVPTLIRLTRIAQEVYWEVRVNAARELYEVSRYIDFRLLDNETIQPLDPLGDLNTAFSHSHLLTLIQKIRARARRLEEPTSSVPYDETFERKDYEEMLQQLTDGQVANFTVSKISLFLNKARIRSLVCEFEPQIKGYYKLVQDGANYFDYDDATKTKYYRLDRKEQTLSSIGNTTTVMALRSPLANWSVMLSDANAELQRVKFKFVLELPSGQSLSEFVSKVEKEEMQSALEIQRTLRRKSREAEIAALEEISVEWRKEQKQALELLQECIKLTTELVARESNEEAEHS